MKLVGFSAVAFQQAFIQLANSPLDVLLSSPGQDPLRAIFDDAPSSDVTVSVACLHGRIHSRAFTEARDKITGSKQSSSLYY